MNDETSVKQFRVRVCCEVEKEIICEGCTEEQARDEPFHFAVEEIELHQISWKVISVREDS